MTTLATPPPAGSRRRAYAPRPWPADHPQWRALDDQLAPDHLARRVDQAVAQLDLHPLEAAYGRTGSPPHEPADLLRVVLFEVERGQHSPAVWWRDSQEAGPVRWLLRGAVPSRSCWYAFRQRLGAVLEELNRQVLHQAVADELTPACRGALDGTLVAANASRHRLVNAATLTKRLAQLAAALTPAADPADPAADLPAAVADGRPPGRPVADGTAGRGRDGRGGGGAARRRNEHRAAAGTAETSGVDGPDAHRPAAPTAALAASPTATGRPAATQPSQADG